MSSGRGNVERRRCQLVISGGARQRLHCDREWAKQSAQAGETKINGRVWQSAPCPREGTK